MLLLLPILLLLLTSLAIAVWHVSRPGFGVPWLTAVGVTLGLWALMVFLRFRLPLQLSFKQWGQLNEPADFPSFLLDPISWMYSFALVGLVLAVMLTASARLVQHTNPASWAQSLSLTALGLLAIVSANPLTLATSWALIDIVELVLMLGLVREDTGSRQVVVAFAARLLGIFVLLWAILLARGRGVILSFAQVPPEVGLYLLLAAGLRLGVLPLHLPYLNEVPLRRGVGTILRMVAAASSLALLARLPAGVVPERLLAALITITALIVLYSSLMWLFAADEMAGRPYWLISLAALAVACVIHGQPVASLAWGMSLLLSGGLLFLYSARQRRTIFLPILGFLGFAGLPFTPAAAGWQGLWALPFSFNNILFILAHAALLAGYLRHALGPANDLTSMERWVQSLYPFGLVILVITGWVAAVMNLRGSFTLGNAWVGGISLLLALSGLAVYARMPVRSFEEPSPAGEGWLGILVRRVGQALAIFFSLRWAYQLFWLVYRTGQRLVQLITATLEGDAGVLWALVLLALLISVLRTSGGAP